MAQATQDRIKKMFWNNKFDLKINELGLHSIEPIILIQNKQQIDPAIA